MKWLALLLFLIPTNANAQDSLAVSLGAWDVEYHVFSGDDYLRVGINPYAEGRAIFLYHKRQFHGVHVRVGRSCASYFPTRVGQAPGLKLAGTGCRMYDFLWSQIQEYINPKPKRKTGPKPLDSW